MAKKHPLIEALEVLLALAAAVSGIVTLVQHQEIAIWQPVLDIVFGAINLGAGTHWLICQRRGGNKNDWKVQRWLMIPVFAVSLVLLSIPMKKNIDQLLFWLVLSFLQGGLDVWIMKWAQAGIKSNASEQKKKSWILILSFYAIVAALIAFEAVKLACEGREVHLILLMLTAGVLWVENALIVKQLCEAPKEKDKPMQE